MKIQSITNYNLNSYSLLKTERQNLETTNSVKDRVFPKSYINFGWCTPHITAMSQLNAQFNLAVERTLKTQEAAMNRINAKNVLKQTRYDLLDNASAKAAKLFSQYCNVQYSTAEMLPTYSLSLNKPLITMMNKLNGLNNPISTLITINNITKLNMLSGIDKNTSKAYTPEQLQKAKSGTQLYTTILLLDRVKAQLKTQNLDDNSKKQVENLIGIIECAVDKIYGNNTYDRIMKLSNIGPNPTLEQKRASIALIQEFDAKSQVLDFGEEFENNLKALIEYQNKAENKTVVNTGKGLIGDVGLKLSYHTHAQEETHHHHHHHGEMTEEEHRLYHLREEQERLKQQQAGHHE